jgi:tetratricopeptide (TPR) repeat protein
MRLSLLCLLVGLSLAAAALSYAWWRGVEGRRAEEALRRFDLAAAADHLERHLQRRPDDTAALFLAARTARRLGRHADAERLLSRYQEVEGVTDATRLEWDLLRIQQGDVGEIDMRLRRTVAPNHPDAPLVLEALARGYLKTDRLRDALEACDLWASRQPEHPWPWLWRGTIFEQLANYQQALADYRKAVENAPDDREARLALATGLARSRQPAEAAEHFESLLARDPDDAEALLGLADCRIEQGQPEETAALADRVLVKSPHSARALYLRGRAARELHEAAAAESWLAEAVRQAPDDPEPLYQLTLVLRGQGKDTEADRLTTRLEQVRRDQARLRELVRAMARAPDEAGPRHEAGVVALRLGRYDDGVRWLLSALRARGDHRPTHAALAGHFERLGDPRAEHHRQLARAPQ